jgi:2-keto-3-deoxy-L-rhamnonate aldolase RhmA
VDLESTPLTYSDLCNILAGARSTELPAIVRLSDLSRATIGRVLDLGADAVCVTRVESAAQVEDIVRYAKYVPVGERNA